MAVRLTDKAMSPLARFEIRFEVGPPGQAARIIIPMAISLGFGIMFATVITLFLIPALYLIKEDIHKLFSRRKAVAETAEQP